MQISGHILPIKSDNRLENLQLITPIENIQKLQNKPIIAINVVTNEEKDTVMTTS